MSYCNWGNTSELNRKYHDTEWGIPVRDDRRHFEYLMLEVMQCGLSWDLVINKRDVLKQCFEECDYDKIAAYGEYDIKRILNTPKMIKSPRKIAAVINNAKCFQQICKEFGSFCKYLWEFSEGKTILYDNHNEGFIPVSNGLSDKISKDLKKRGFKYMGTIVIYSYLQACGIINDHDKNCPIYQHILQNYPTVCKPCFSENNVCKF